VDNLELCDAVAPSPIVLVVDDEVLIRWVVADELREAGLTVIEASTADEALALLATGIRVYIVLSDVVMPGSMNGIELARLVKANYPHIGILLTSGNAFDVQDLAPLLKKPYRPEMLVDLVLNTMPKRNVTSLKDD